MGLHPLPLRESFKYDAYERPRGNSHDPDGFNKARFNRHEVIRARYDMNGHYGGHQQGHGVSVDHFRCDVPAPRAAAWRVNGSRTSIVTGEQRASNGGNAAGTVRAEAPVGMAGEANMRSR